MAVENKKDDKKLEKKPKEVKAPPKDSRESRLMIEAREAEKEGLNGIVHLVGKDIGGKTKITEALRQVKGVGIRLSSIFSELIFKQLGIPKDTYVGKLSDEDIEKLEKIIQTPREHGVPGWLLNRQKDLETGKDKHLIGSDLTFSVKQDIEREKELYTWRGFRHIYAKKVRGQHTRTSGRRGITMGVAKKTVMAARAAAAAPATKPAEKK
jgi:small subunit ribosomal protein S13